MYFLHDFADDSGLMSYGPNINDKQKIARHCCNFQPCAFMHV